MHRDGSGDESGILGTNRGRPGANRLVQWRAELDARNELPEPVRSGSLRFISCVAERLRERHPGPQCRTHGSHGVGELLIQQRLTLPSRECVTKLPNPFPDPEPDQDPYPRVDQ
jgi:hypothetical protein